MKQLLIIALMSLILFVPYSLKVFACDEDLFPDIKFGSSNVNVKLKHTDHSNKIRPEDSNYEVAYDDELKQFVMMEIPDRFRKSSGSNKPLEKERINNLNPNQLLNIAEKNAIKNKEESLYLKNLEFKINKGIPAETPEDKERVKNTSIDKVYTYLNNIGSKEYLFQ